MKYYSYETADTALPRLADDVLNEGSELGSRQGERVMEITYPHIVLSKPWRREILTRGRKASIFAQIAETMWVLSGRDDVAWLSHYLPRAADFSDDGEVWRGAYGPRIRRWGKMDSLDVVDQLRYVVDELHAQRSTRRAVINIYDPAVDTDPGKDIPCNNWLHFLNRRGAIDLHVATRSNDLFWGWSGINAFEWSALQEIVAGLVGASVGELHFSISSLHLYDRHWQRAGKLSGPLELNREDSPRFSGSAVHNHGPEHLHPVERLDDLITQWFAIETLIRDSNRTDDELRSYVDAFPEPMLQSWLRVIAWYWRGGKWVYPLAGTRLYDAIVASPRPKHQEKDVETATVVALGSDEPVRTDVLSADPFTRFVYELHAEKHAAYGDSWKRRGEMIGILANIARKVDRLGVAGGGDTAADTVIDLLVYLVKYRLWLSDEQMAVRPMGVSPTVGPLSDHVLPVTELLVRIDEERVERDQVDEALRDLREAFNDLEDAAENRDAVEVKVEVVEQMIPLAAGLARFLWNSEQWKLANETRTWKGYEDQPDEAGKPWSKA